MAQQQYSRRSHSSNPYNVVGGLSHHSKAGSLSKNYIKLAVVALFVLFCTKFLFFMDPLSLEEVQGFHNQTMVEFHTKEGKFTIELFSQEAPKTVDNFLKLVKNGFYEGARAGFYRHEQLFALQGGGFLHGNKPPSIDLPVEYNLPSVERTVILARSSSPNSGNSEFAIMLKDNSYVNSPDQDDPGYTTFGKIYQGWNTILRIASKLPTGFLSQADFNKVVLFDKTEIVSRAVPVDRKLKKVLETVMDHIGNEYRVTLFSKTFCPYCTKVKKILTELQASYDVIELDTLKDGTLYQDGLESISGRRTVPNVFVNGVSIGGCDDTEKLFHNGQLQVLLKDAGVFAEAYVRKTIHEHPCVVFSKSTCPFCAKAKEAISSIHGKMFVLELDQMKDGPAIQVALTRLTGQTTVPNVFIGGKTIGGGDNTVRLKETGELLALLQRAGAYNSVAQR